MNEKADVGLAAKSKAGGTAGVGVNTGVVVAEAVGVNEKGDGLVSAVLTGAVGVNEKAGVAAEVASTLGAAVGVKEKAGVVVSFGDVCILDTI